MLVFGLCKSAGTLLCVGANRIYATDDVDFGPIDVQLRKPDEVGERTSGLTPLQALDVLQIRSLGLFKAHFRQLRFDEDLAFSTKVAAEIATNLSVGLMRELYEQVDPIRLAEVERSLRIAGEYGERLRTPNVKEGGLERLLGQYPSHSFVIDKIEARKIFEEVVDPPADLAQVVQLLRDVADRYLWADSPFATYVSDQPPAPLVAVEPEHVETTQDHGAGGDRAPGQQQEVQPAVQSGTEGR